MPLQPAHCAYKRNTHEHTQVIICALPVLTVGLGLCLLRSFVRLHRRLSQQLTFLFPCRRLVLCVARADIALGKHPCKRDKEAPNEVPVIEGGIEGGIARGEDMLSPSVRLFLIKLGPVSSKLGSSSNSMWSVSFCQVRTEHTGSLPFDW